MKKAIIWGAVAFVLFYLFTQPQQSADAVRAGLGLLESGAQSVGTFFDSLA